MAAHSHPDVSNGGSEIAAYQLFRGLRSRVDCQAWFLGCDRSSGAERLGAVLTQPYGEEEYIYNAGDFDWFKFANRDPLFPAAFGQLIQELAPDVVHFHHYLNFGVEALAHVKRAAPTCRIVLTLHEYLGICHHYGQMVTKQHLNPCYKASPRRCNQCFPEISRSDFFLRKLYIDRFFRLVDHFIAPSRFLADRYIAWGVPAERMTVLENLMPPPPVAAAAPPPAAAEEPLRVGFFGQISALKGIDVAFDAAAHLAKNDMGAVSFDIFGDYHGQPPEFQAAFLERLGKAGPNIRFNGPYDRLRVDQLMQSVDAVLVPSLWWENSPVVIQEALRNRRPVLCSDIGGMAEKVRDRLDGVHFPAGNALALASLLRRLAADRTILAGMSAGMVARRPAALEDYLAVYRGAPVPDGEPSAAPASIAAVAGAGLAT